MDSRHRGRDLRRSSTSRAFLQPRGGGAAPTDALATVDGRKVTGRHVPARVHSSRSRRCARRTAISSTTRCCSSSASAQRMLQQLHRRRGGAWPKPTRLGIRVSDEELQRAHPARFPSFQMNGQFIGVGAVPSSSSACSGRRCAPTDFEHEVRRQIDRREAPGARHRLGAGGRQPRSSKEYRKRNEKVKLELAVFTANQFRDAHSADRRRAQGPVRRPTRRSTGCRRSAASGTWRSTPTSLKADDDGDAGRKCEALYQQNKATYSTPEQIRASHILLQDRGQGRSRRARSRPKRCSPR